MKTTFRRTLSSSLALLLLLCCTANAATVPFEEDFPTDSSLWTNFNSSAFLTHVPTGGPDGGSYVEGTFNFVNSQGDGQGPVVFRAETTPGGPASGGNFFGNWLTDGVGKFRASVRHNAPVPLTFFTRFADTINFPGATAIQFAPVLPHTWTELEFAINPSSPNFVTFEGESFAAVFDNIGRLQLGVSIPAALAGVDQEITFGLDKVEINVPEPTTLLFGCLGVLAGLSAGRRSGR